MASPDQFRLSVDDLRPVEQHPHGTVYAGRDAHGAGVTVAILGEPAAADPTVRNAFADTVWRHSVGAQAIVYDADLQAPQPWAATRGSAEGGSGAGRLLTALPPSTPAGSPPLVPPPAYSIPPAGLPKPPGRRPAWLVPLLAAGAAAATLAAAVGAVVLVVQDGPEPDPAPPLAAAPTSPPAPGSPTPPNGGNGQPELRPVEQISVIGPTYQRPDDTFTMQFSGWPFAFRTGADWDCFAVDDEEFPDADLWACASGDEGAALAVRVALWECPDDCAREDRDDLQQMWLGAPDHIVHMDPPTAYVEERPRDEPYVIKVAHFFGEPLQWFVGISGHAGEYEDREVVHKIINDIVSQTQ